MGEALLGGSGLLIGGWLWPKIWTAERTNDCLFMFALLASWLAILFAEISPARRGVQRNKVLSENVMLLPSLLLLETKKRNKAQSLVLEMRAHVQEGGWPGRYPRELCSSWLRVREISLSTPPAQKQEIQISKIQVSVRQFSNRICVVSVCVDDGYSFNSARRWRRKSPGPAL